MTNISWKIQKALLKGIKWTLQQDPHMSNTHTKLCHGLSLNFLFQSVFVRFHISAIPFSFSFLTIQVSFSFLATVTVVYSLFVIFISKLEASFSFPQGLGVALIQGTNQTLSALRDWTCDWLKFSVLIRICSFSYISHFHSSSYF